MTLIATSLMLFGNLYRSVGADDGGIFLRTLLYGFCTLVNEKDSDRSILTDQIP